MLRRSSSSLFLKVERPSEDKTLCILTRTDELIIAIKHKVSTMMEQDPVDSENVRLIFNNLILEDHCTVRDAGLTDGERVDLLLKLPGTDSFEPMPSTIEPSLDMSVV